MATKMTREEAIKIVQSATVWTDEERDALAMLIPELAESEDERIWKRLIEYFEGFRIGNANVKWEGLTVQDVLAWLEKQKEHAEDLETEIDLYSEEHFEYNSEYDTLSPKGGFYFSPRTLSDIARHFYSLGRKYGGEQDGMITVSKEAWDENAKDSFERGIKVGRIRQQKEQKPAEVDESTKRLNDNWMKQHFDDYQEQKPAEWSEEDEEMLNSCISSIEESKENRYAYKETDGDTSYDREVDWLKSLRPSWKPSEDELAKKHLDGYCMGREDTLREMKDFVESHFNCENAKKGTPIVYNTQSGTATLKAEG